MLELMSCSISLDCFAHLFQIGETKMHKCGLVTSMFSLLWSMHPYALFWINAPNIQKLNQSLNKSDWKYWHSAPLESWQFTHQLSFFEVFSRNQRKQKKSCFILCCLFPSNETLKTIHIYTFIHMLPWVYADNLCGKIIKIYIICVKNVHWYLGNGQPDRVGQMNQCLASTALRVFHFHSLLLVSTVS